jgi:hypothetical protein
VVYLSAEKFMYQFIRALRFKDTMAFKEQFRSVDVLMIDDVQFISGKDSLNNEFSYEVEGSRGAVPDRSVGRIDNPCCRRTVTIPPSRRGCARRWSGAACEVRSRSSCVGSLTVRARPDRLRILTFVHVVDDRELNDLVAEHVGPAAGMAAEDAELLGVALIVLVLRMLLAQAVARDIEAAHLQAELEEVI